MNKKIIILYLIVILILGISVSYADVVSVPGESTFYYITASAGTGGDISPSGRYKVAKGGTAMFSMVPNDGYYLSKVVVDGQEVKQGSAGLAMVYDGVNGASGTYRFTNVTGSHTISATFSKMQTATQQFTISALASPGGSINPSGAIKVNKGENAVFSISADAGYYLEKLLVDGQEIKEGSPNYVTGRNGVSSVPAMYTFKNVTSNHEIKATFVKSNNIDIKIILGKGGKVSAGGNAIVLPNNGFITGPNEGTIRGSIGKKAIVLIEVDKDYEIFEVFVDGNVIPTSNLKQDGSNYYSYEFSSLDENHSFEVTFKEKLEQYTITASAGEGGKISPTGQVKVNKGENSIFSISANDGYYLEKLLVDGQEIKEGSPNYVTGRNGVSSVPAMYTFENVTSNHEITATFVKSNNVDISVKVGRGGKVSAGGNAIVLPNNGFITGPNEGTIRGSIGKKAVVLIEVNKAYEIFKVFVDGNVIPTSNLKQDGPYNYSYEFSSLDVNHSFEVTFKETPKYQETENVALECTKPTAEYNSAGPDVVVLIEIDLNDGSDNAKSEYIVGVPSDYKLKSASREKYGFLGWMYDDGSIHNAGEEFKVVSSSPYVPTYTLTAKWVGRASLATSGDEQTTPPVETTPVVAPTEQPPEVNDKFTIDVVSKKGGSIKPYQDQEVTKGSNLSFEITVDEGYELTGVSVDGRDVSKDLTWNNGVATYTFRNIEDDHTIMPKFTQIVKEDKKPEETKVVQENIFDDVGPDDWYYESIKYVTDKKLFNGLSEKEFGPNKRLTRGMLVTILYRYSGADETQDSSFIDVDKSMYYSKPISWASKLGVVNGVGDNQFSPESDITRQDLVTILYRYASLNKNVSKNGILDYLDVDKISNYAIDAFRWAIGSGIINGKGDNKIAPIDNATRAEMAAIMLRMDSAK